MITIKKIYNNDLEKLITYEEIEASFKKQADYNESKEYFAIMDGNTLLGHASLKLFKDDSIIQIHELYVLPEERNNKLGDGLFRAILNYGRINFCKLAIIEDKEISNSFLIKEEMKKTKHNELMPQVKKLFEENKSNNYYICNIEEFFNKKCNGCKI